MEPMMAMSRDWPSPKRYEVTKGRRSYGFFLSSAALENQERIMGSLLS